MGAVKGFFEELGKRAARQADELKPRIEPPPLKPGESALDAPAKGTPGASKPAQKIKRKLDEGSTAPGEGAEQTPLEHFGVDPEPVEIPPAMTGEEGTPVAAATAAAKARGDIEQEAVYTNFRNIDAPDQLKEFMFKVGDDFADEFNEYSRGVQTFDRIEARAIAGMTGSSTDDVLNLRAGDPEGFTRASFALLKQAEEMQKLASVGSENLSQADLVKLRVMMENYTVSAMHLKGQQTEVARTLSAMRIVKKSVADGSADVNEILDQLGGEAFSRQAAEHLRVLNDPSAIGRYVDKARRVGVPHMLWEAFYASLLSSPQTHVINGLTSTAAYALTMPQQLGAYVSGIVRAGVAAPFGKTVDRQSWQETAAFMADMDTIQYATRRAWRALKSGNPDDATAKLEGFARKPAITVENLKQLKPVEIVNRYLPLLETGSMTQIAADYLFDWTVRGPMRVMVTMDEFNKGLAYQSFLKKEAVRYAQDIGVGGVRFDDTLREFMEAPDRFVPGVEAQASTFAQEMTFQQPLGQFGRRAQQVISSDVAPKAEGDPLNLVARAGQTVLRLHVPFVKTPINLIKWAATNTAPINIVGFSRELSKGGRAADMAVSKMVIATGLAYGTWNWVMSGYVTGSGPQDRRLNAHWRGAGNQPYAIAIPKGSAFGKHFNLEKDLSVQIKRADPFTQWLGAMADWRDLHQWATEDEQATAAGIFATVMYENIGNKTFMMSIGRLQDALGRMEDGDGGRAATEWAETLVTSPLVPAGARWYGSTFTEQGPVLRDTKSAKAQERAVPGQSQSMTTVSKQVAEVFESFERLKNRVASRAPGYGEDLPARLDFWGGEIRFANNGPLWNIFPFFTKDLKWDLGRIESLGMDPGGWTGHSAAQLGPGKFVSFIHAGGVEGEFMRLGWAPGYHPDRIKGIPLTPAERHDFIKSHNAPADGGFLIGPRGAPIVEYDGLDMRSALKELMLSEEYFEASDFPQQPDSKASLITRVVSDYRWKVGGEEQVGAAGTKLGGAALRFFQQHPEFQMRFLRGEAFLKPEGEG